MKNKCRVCVLIMLGILLFSACGKSTISPEESDWRELYGTPQNGTLTPEPEKPTAAVEPTAKPTNKPGGIDFSSIELPYPTSLPVREFVPEEGQVELVLWLFGSHEEFLDDHIVAELNYILQERGCSFYLSKRVEPRENKVGQISRWQEALDSGETVDLIFLGAEDIGLAYREYGNTAIVRAITGGYLLPFSEYPETEAKERLLLAYPEEYWRLCRFKGDIYGVSNSLSEFVKQKYYLMLNLDAAEQGRIEIPEELDVLNLDELLRQADEAGIPGIEWTDKHGACGIKNLYSGLYVKYLPDGEYRIVNPVEDEELLSLWDALYRYYQQGWQGNAYITGEIPLVMYELVTDENWDGERIYVRSKEGDCSARVKIYEEQELFWVEGQYNQMLGIYSGSQHKEEALELLSLMHADEEIVQLLRYGIEGVHYRMGEDGIQKVVTSELNVFENGYSIGEKEWSSPGRYSFGNHLMYVDLEEQLGKENKEKEWYAKYADIERIPYLEDFTEEQKRVQEKIREITYIVADDGMRISDKAGSLVMLNENYQSQIEELRTAFAEAGYNELAKEVNEVYGLE